MRSTIRRSWFVAAAATVAVAGLLGPAAAMAKATNYYVLRWGGLDTDCVTGSSSATPLQTIEFALGCATSGSDTVYIEALDDTHFIYNPAATLVVTSKVTIVGTGPNFNPASPIYPAIDAGGNFRVLENQSANTVITNVELDNGGKVDKGGGIWNHPKGAVLTLNGVLVYGNTAQFGGGIYNEGTLNATNTIIESNTATGANIGECSLGGGVTGRGGGIFNDGTPNGPGATLNLSRVSIIANTAMSTGCADGGGIFNLDGTVSLTNGSSVTSNNATGGAGVGGGGIANFPDPSSNVAHGNVSVTASTVSDNRLQCPIFIPAGVCGSGAGIVNLGTLDLTDATVNGNAPFPTSGPIWGGGIYTSNDSTVSIHKGTVNVIGNSVGGSVGQGGGIYSYGFFSPVGVVQFLSNSTTHLDSNSGGQCGGTGDFDRQGGGVSLYCNGVLVSLTKGPCPCP